MTKRIEVARSPVPLEEYLRHFDPLFGKSNQREGCATLCGGPPSAQRATQNADRIGQHRTGSRSSVAASPDAARVSDRESDWDERQVQAERIKLLREDPTTTPTAQGVLVIDETGDRKDGHKTAHVARQYLGNRGKIDNGVVSVTRMSG